MLARSLSTLVSLSILGTGVAKAQDYDFVSVPHSEIDQHLVIGSSENGTPEELGGLWWMDGNPLPDEVVSFAGANFEAIFNESGELEGHVGIVPVYDEGVWSYHDTEIGRFLVDLARLVRLHYVVEFNASFTEAQITPSFSPTPRRFELPPSRLLDFRMSRISENEYLRDSEMFGTPMEYRFRRIVTADGERLPAFQEYLDAIAERGPENALLPVCTANTADRLPTSCVKQPLRLNSQK